MIVHCTLYECKTNHKDSLTHGKPSPNVDHHVGVTSVLGFHERVLVLQLLGASVVGLSNSECLAKLGFGLRYIQRLLRKELSIKMKINVW